MQPQTRFALSGDVNIAYQVVGEGPIDLVFVMGWVSNIDEFWTEPSFARFLERLARFSRLIIFDKRGTGLSDRVDDKMSIVFAATYPERTHCLMTFGSYARATVAPDYP